MITFEKTDQGEDYTTGCLLDYNYSNKYYKMIAIDLSKFNYFRFFTKNCQSIVILYYHISIK